MRIAHVCRVAWPSIGGMEAVVGGLSGELVARGHAVRVISLDRSPGGKPLHSEVRGGVRYIRLPGWGPRRYPLALGLRAALGDAAIAHAHGLDGLTDAVVLGRRCHSARVGVSTHGGFFHTDRHLGLKRLWLGTATRLTLSLADAVWFSSKADQQQLAGAGAAGTVMPNGVDLRRFEAVRRRPEAGRWLVPGRVDAHKGHADLISALARLDPADRPRVVRITGPCRDPQLDAALRLAVSRAGLHGVVELVGAVSDAQLEEELGRAALAVFPSRHEGFGIAVVEALAAGVPVVASPIPPFDELVQHGRSGWRVDFADPDAGARGLKDAAARNTEVVVRGGREVAGRYSWKGVAGRWEQAYRALLAGRE